MSFSLLVSTFANNILPIILISGAGFSLGKLLHIDSRSLGRVVFYIFSPLLIFNIMMNNQLDTGDAILVIGFTLSLELAMGVIAFLLSTLLKLERPALIAVLITTMFANTGNYGLPLVSFAFGEKALSYAAVYFVTTTFAFYTLGVLIASLGHMNFKEALLGLFKVPTLYAVALAIVINALKIEIPMPIARTVELAAGGTIPVMLILLGVELTRVEFSSDIRAMQLTVPLRLIVAPMGAFLFAALFNMHGPIRDASVTQASMPSIVSSTVLATEYQLDSKLITAVVFISTLLSPITLTLLLVYLGR